MRCQAPVKLRWNEKLHASSGEFLSLIGEALQDTDPDIRLSAAKTARVLADSTIVPRAVELAPLLTDADSHAIWRVIKAMQELGTTALPLLCELAAQDTPANE